MRAIKKCLTHYPVKNAEQIFDSLHKQRQKLIEPIRKTDEEFISAWENINYEGKTFYEDAPRLYTMKGERVRSKSEVMIADLLSREGIPYRYEYPIHLNDVGQVYPDFTVLHQRLRKEIYWEHLGMMDDADYVDKAVHKIASYEQSGIFPGKNLILTYETRKHPLNLKEIMLVVQEYLR